MTSEPGKKEKRKRKLIVRDHSLSVIKSVIPWKVHTTTTAASTTTVAATTTTTATAADRKKVLNCFFAHSHSIFLFISATMFFFLFFSGWNILPSLEKNAQIISSREPKGRLDVTFCKNTQFSFESGEKNSLSGQCYQNIFWGEFWVLDISTKAWIIRKLLHKST